MSRYRKWVLTLGIIVVTPGITMAGPKLFPFFKSKASRSAERTGGRKQAPASRNQQVADNIARALRAANLSGYDIAIEFQGGVATLSGSVADGRLKAKAERIVGSVPGVKRVNNRLKTGDSGLGGLTTTTAEFQTGGNPAAGTLQPAGFQSETPAPFQRETGRSLPSLPAGRLGESPSPASNQEYAQDVADALTQSGLSGYDVEIRFNNGRVVLTGSVGNPAQREKAEEAAYSVKGVQSVENRLQVAGQSRQFSSPARSPISPATATFQPGATQPPMPTQPPMTGQPGPPPPGAGAPPAIPMPPQNYGHPGAGARQAMYNMPNFPEYAWPSYASYPNYAQVSYPKEYSASAWPYIGPFYPYPQIPLGWRQVQLEWDDGSWNLNFRPRTDKWWWFLNPKNW